MKQIESTHAQEHWLRISASKAVALAVGQYPLGGDTVLQDLIGNAALRMETALANTDETVTPREQIERAAAYLLRAAVILRREETRR